MKKVEGTSLLKRDTFVKDILITFSGQIFVLLSNFLINKLVSIFVGVDQFGIFNIAKRSATLIGFVILLELGISIPRYFSLYFKSNPKKAFEYYKLGCFLLITMIVFVSIIVILNQKMVAQYIFGSINFTKYVLPWLIYSIGIAINTFIFSAYRGSERFYIYTIIQLLTQIINVLIIFIVKNSGIAMILLFWGISNIILSVLFMNIFILINYEFKSVGVEGVFHKLKDLLIYGIPRIPGEIIQFSYYLIPLMVVNHKFGRLDTGYFSASTGIIQAFLPLFSYVGIVLLPKVSKSLMDGNLKLVKNQVKLLSYIYLAFALLVVVLGLVFTKDIIKVLYSSEYIRRIDVAKILLITLIPRSQFLLLRNPIDAISVKPINTLCLSISFIAMLAIMFFAHNIIMVAWSFVISDIILAILSLLFWRFLVNKKIGR